MAKARRAGIAPAAKSTPTGLVWPCTAMQALHPTKRIALPIKRGPKVCFLRCPVCGTNTHLGPGWSANLGMTAEDAERAGFYCL